MSLPADVPARYLTVLAAVDDATAVDVRPAPPDDRDGWLPLPAELRTLGRRHATVTAAVEDPLAAASYLAAWLTQVPSALVGTPAVLGGVVAQARLAYVLVRPTGTGRLDGYALGQGTRWTTGSPDEVLAATAQQLVGLTAPIVAAVTRQLPVGAAAVWGSLVDDLVDRCVRVAGACGWSRGDAWSAAAAQVDALAAAVGVSFPRPRPLTVALPAGDHLAVLPGTCCRSDRTDDGRCPTCPLRDEDQRAELVRAELLAVTP